ncbi:DsbA family protein [Cedecea sp. NFIX57]|uniref:DsbA family protein n=1 Tax=Cedecea sp. NFIX57 TaxID=1566286 RepID=UPI000A097A64|nr:DsbA family protein [Cedecea sp. NFIX57]SMG25138.1 Protein-disulfide isomerase [Cedecea sp. NFIX57]
MKYVFILILSLFSGLTLAAKEEPAPFSAEQQKQLEVLIEQALFNDPASPRFGAKKPVLTLVNFTDYNCPYCKQLDPMLEKIVQKYPDVAVIVKPLPFKGESSVLSARTVLTTWRQHPDQFLALHEKLMQKKGYHDATSIATAVEKSGATPVTPDEKSMETLSTNLQLARIVGVQGTPATIIGDEMIPGAVPWETLEEVVKEKLAAAHGK